MQSGSSETQGSRLALRGLWLMNLPAAPVPESANRTVKALSRVTSLLWLDTDAAAAIVPQAGGGARSAENALAAVECAEVAFVRQLADELQAGGAADSTPTLLEYEVRALVLLPVLCSRSHW